MISPVFTFRKLALGGTVLNREKAELHPRKHLWRVYVESGGVNGCELEDFRSHETFIWNHRGTMNRGKTHHFDEEK